MQQTDNALSGTKGQVYKDIFAHHHSITIDVIYIPFFQLNSWVVIYQTQIDGLRLFITSHMCERKI